MVLAWLLAYNILCAILIKLSQRVSRILKYAPEAVTSKLHILVNDPIHAWAGFVADFLSPGSLAAVIILLVMRLLSDINARRAYDKLEAATEELERAAKEKSKRFEQAYVSDSIDLEQRPCSGTEGHADSDEGGRPIDNPTEESKSQVSKSAGNQDDLECPICLEEYAVGHRIVTLPCDHRFHGQCSKQHHESSFTCPSCTRKLGWTFCFVGEDNDDSDEADVADEVAAAAAADEGFVGGRLWGWRHQG